MSIVIETAQLSKWFGEVVALNNLDLTVGTGVTGLLGPNGAGKSTFIKLALGLYRPSRGYIRVLGEKPHNNRRVLRRIGYCPEMDKFYENMTGYEFVYWMSRYWGMSGRAARKASEEACEQVHMTERMYDPIDEYSRGMRQRIKLAQALAIKPDILFLDEPMIGLDPKGREEMYALVRHLGREGYPVLVSSHILYEIERVTDNVVLLYDGAMLAQGRVREIRALIDKHPHTISVGADDPRGLSKGFVDAPGTLSIEYGEGKVIVRTRDPNACYQHLNDAALNGSIAIESIHCSDDSLQAVFDYLVKG
jgi:ABC-2 type transport system ATP-binding protein